MAAGAKQTTASEPRVLRLGIIGLPEQWEPQYRSALARIGPRIRTTAVYDAIPLSARRVAESLAAEAISGARQLIAKPSLDGVLLLDCGWLKEWGLGLALACDRPVFVGIRVLEDVPDWRQLAERAQSDSLIVPECRLRYLPSVLRMRELLASRLRAPQEVMFWLPQAQQRVDPTLALREVMAWFLATFPVRSPSISIAADVATEGVRAARVDGVTLSDGKITLRIVSAAPDVPPGAIPTEDETAPFCTVTCADGEVHLLGTRRLLWKTEQEVVTEELEGDRSACCVALDLFARRAVGGLIPVPTLSDLARAQELADQIADVCSV